MNRPDFWTGVVLGVLLVGAFLTFVPPVLIPALLRNRRLKTRPGWSYWVGWADLLQAAVSA